jgi:hypothetical protein
MSLPEERIEQVRRLSRRLDELDAERAKVVAALAELIGQAPAPPPNVAPAPGNGPGQHLFRLKRRKARSLDGRPTASPALLEVAAALKKLARPGGADDLADALGLKPEAARIRMKRAAAAGVIVKVERGQYVDWESAQKTPKT